MTGLHRDAASHNRAIMQRAAARPALLGYVNPAAYTNQHRPAAGQAGPRFALPPGPPWRQAPCPILHDNRRTRDGLGHAALRAPLGRHPSRSARRASLPFNVGDKHRLATNQTRHPHLARLNFHADRRANFFPRAQLGASAGSRSQPAPTATPLPEQRPKQKEDRHRAQSQKPKPLRPVRARPSFTSRSSIWPASRYGKSESSDPHPKQGVSCHETSA